jgi:hypothetical protein
MQGLRFRTNPPYGGAVEILRMYYRAQMCTIGQSSSTVSRLNGSTVVHRNNYCHARYSCHLLRLRRTVEDFFKGRVAPSLETNTAVCYVGCYSSIICWMMMVFYLCEFARDTNSFFPNRTLPLIDRPRIF